MTEYDPNDTVRQCVSCKRCFASTMQFCPDCLVELTAVEVIPRTINSRYQLERIIKQGATGYVFAATNLENGKEVAVKVIRASSMADPRAQDRFRREAQLAINFHHPGIGAVYDFGMLPDASAYVVSEFVKGTSLKNAISKIGNFDIRTTIEILAEVCDALDAAHKAGLVHRDLKPESIILLETPDQSAPLIKIVDFSYSKVSSGAEFVPGTTQKLQAQGKMPLQPTYLSPEQFRGEEADLRSDIYSLGVIVYEMLGGKPPFTAQRVGEFGIKLLNSRPPSLRTLNPDVNVIMEAEILRALEKDPLDRPQRASEFKRDLVNASHLT